MDPKSPDPQRSNTKAQPIESIIHSSQIAEKKEDDATIVGAQLIHPKNTYITSSSQPSPTETQPPVSSQKVNEGTERTETLQSKPSLFLLVPVSLRKSRTGDSEQPQSDSADEHRHDQPETLQRIFANAQRSPSKEPQMEEHRLDRFRLTSYDDEQEQYGEDDEYIEDQTLNVLCSPLLGNSQEICLPPPTCNRPHEQSEQEAEQQRQKDTQGRERGVVGENENDVLGG